VELYEELGQRLYIYKNLIGFFFFFLFSGLKGKVIVGSWQNAFEVRELIKWVVCNLYYIPT
jgi:hypothetical protein